MQKKRVDTACRYQNRSVTGPGVDLRSQGCINCFEGLLCIKPAVSIVEVRYPATKDAPSIWLDSDDIALNPTEQHI